ncbi:DUF2931 family protein [Pseudomonas kuykendallii]|uniref:DUF2931 domain-containing protein n=1 Tax=Pseudomonas kuykendallii TaxID=1007099 RepID=A0A1H2SSX9_9PSED|nr:DUF2931 family protein [Pseudomonas kuykendallii]MCQ4270620.1 DUF2931 family protein [Pseudomonas kuykendallii]SDW34565.1 Protein of unknown function [Pseudomonas kuykendallii]
MNELKRLCVLCFGLVLTGCVHGLGRPLPYESWWLGFGGPSYMEVWIETADAVDIQGHVFRRAMSGIASVQTPPNFKGKPEGWPANPGGGKGKNVHGADLPRLIYVRWQSLAEPQTYEAYIEIPEATRQQMLSSEQVYCRGLGKWITDYRNTLTIGLAPGGVTKTWIMGVCLSAIEVARVQGAVVKIGPFLGRSGGQYALPLEPESKAYIEKFGIPYGSW